MKLMALFHAFGLLTAGWLVVYLVDWRNGL